MKIFTYFNTGDFIIAFIIFILFFLGIFMLFIYIIMSKSKIRGRLHQYGSKSKAQLLYLKQGNIDYVHTLTDFEEYEECKKLWRWKADYHPPPDLELGPEDYHPMKDRLRLDRILRVRNHHHHKRGQGGQGGGKWGLEEHFEQGENGEKRYGDEEIDISPGKDVNVNVKDNNWDDREGQNPQKGIFMSRLDLTHYQKKYKSARVFDYRADYLDGDEASPLKSGAYRHGLSALGDTHTGGGSTNVKINIKSNGTKGKRILDRGEASEYTAMFDKVTIGGGLNLQKPAGGTIEYDQYKIPHLHSKGHGGGMDTLEVDGGGSYGHLTKSGHGVSMRDKYGKGGAGFKVGDAGRMDLQNSYMRHGNSEHQSHHVNLEMDVSGSDMGRSRYNLGDNPYKKRWGFE